jgi:hypothetical protein
MRISLVLSVAVVFSCLCAPPARADTAEADKQAAAAHYRQGRTYADAGDYDHAIAEYLKANELLPKPLLLFHIAEAYRLKGDSREALRYYQQYLEAEPDGKPAGTARKYTASLSHDLQTQEAVQDRDGDGVLDASDRCPAVAARTPDGCPADRDGDGVADDRDRDRCPAVAAASTDGCPAAPSGGHLGTRRKLALGLGGAGILGLATSAGFGLHARSQWNDAQRSCTAAACDAAGHDKAASASNAATVATIAFGAGAAALAAGVYLYLTAPAEAPAQRAQITPGIVDGTVGLTVTGSF